MSTTYTVSELCTDIKNLLEREFINNIKVIGEISGIKISGKHTYLTLKDDLSAVNIIFWSTHLANSHGEKVEIVGKLNYYSKTNSVNVIGKSITNIGQGQLHQMYEELKAKYESQGYFDHKLPLPSAFHTIGIITSNEGAALQDILYVLRNNNFDGTVYIYDCIVQGSQCASSVEKAINYFNTIEDLDALVLTRGGGSFEDLMGFSDARVLEALYNSKHYTISAVGHEIDHMLSDYVANYRAPTPSVAAEVIASAKNKTDTLVNEHGSIKSNLLIALHRYKENLAEIEKKINNSSQQVKDNINDILHENNVLRESLLAKLKQQQMHLDKMKSAIAKTNIHTILEQGYILLLSDGNIVKSSDIFDKEIVMLHSSGKYTVCIKKI